MVARFVARGATARERARTLEELGLSSGIILHRLENRAVVRHAEANHYYVDEESWAAVRRSRRRAVSVGGAVVLALLLALLFGTRRAISGQELRSSWPDVDAIFADLARPGSPGCAVGVFQGGRISYQRGYGLASVEHGVPITPDTVFYAGSVSKQFTAFAAAIAIQNGSLSADDPVRRWLPELPTYADAITVRHLLHHTSGLRDYNTLLSIAGRRGDEAFDNPTVLRMTARQKKLNFAPGTEYLYSNTGYTLLATIVERATKTPFAEFADRSIFRPLDMRVTHFHTDTGRLVPGRALAYSGPLDSLRLDTPVNERAGAGGLYTSVPDLLRWDENFYTAKIGGARLIDQVQTPGRLVDGRALNYAWGLTIGTYRGKRIVEHSGSLGGYRAQTLRFPELHTSVVALCNLATADPGTRSRRVADIVLKERFTEPVPPPRAVGAAVGGGPRAGVVTGDAAPGAASGALTAFAGVYESDEIDATFTVLVKDDRLMLQRDTDAEPVVLQPVAEGTFRARTLTIRFERAGARVDALIVDAGRVRDIRFERKR